MLLLESKHTGGGFNHRTNAKQEQQASSAEGPLPPILCVRRVLVLGLYGGRGAYDREPLLRSVGKPAKLSKNKTLAPAPGRKLRSRSEQGRDDLSPGAPHPIASTGLPRGRPGWNDRCQQLRGPLASRRDAPLPAFGWKRLPIRGPLARAPAKQGQPRHAARASRDKPAAPQPAPPAAWMARRRRGLSRLPRRRMDRKPERK